VREPEKAQPLDVVLHLEPHQPQHPWRAVLFNPQTGERWEFASPLELLQHLEQLCLALGGRITGIR